MAETLTIQFWNDLICPMCPIGHAQLQQALAGFPEAAKVKLIYRTSRLRPGVAPHSVETYLQGKYGKDKSVAPILAMVEQMGAEAGLVYKMGNTLAGDTMDAHRLMHLAQSQGLQERAVELIHAAHFTREGNIFDKETLLNLAVEIGLERQLAASMLDSEQFKAEVEHDEQLAGQLQIHSVPFFLIGNIRVDGRRSPAQFLATLQQAWAAHASGDSGC